MRRPLPPRNFLAMLCTCFSRKVPPRLLTFLAWSKFVYGTFVYVSIFMHYNAIFTFLVQQHLIKSKIF